MKTGGKITTLIVLALLVAGGVTTGVVSHNQKVHAEQIQLVREQQAKKVARQSEQRLKKQAEKLVQQAYQSRQTTDITSAQAAIKRLNNTNRINLTTQLTTLKNLLAQAKAAADAVTKAEQSHTEADIKAAQKLVDLQLDPFFKKDRAANQQRLDALGSTTTDSAATATTDVDQSATTDAQTTDTSADTTNAYNYNDTTTADTSTNYGQNSNQTWWWPATDTTNNYQANSSVDATTGTDANTGTMDTTDNNTSTSETTTDQTGTTTTGTDNNDQISSGQ